MAVVATASITVKFHNFPSGRVEYHYHPKSTVQSATTTTTTTAAAAANDPQQIDGDPIIRSISWSKDGNWLALVPYYGCTEIISIKNKLKLIHTIESFVEPSCVSFQNTTKKNLVIGTRGGQIYLYDIKTRNKKKTFSKATSMVTHVEFSSKDNYIVANYGNGETNLFSNVTNTLVGVLRMPKTHFINTIKTNPIKNNLIVGGSKDGAVTVWDINNTNKVRFFNEVHKAPVCTTIFSPIHSDLILSTGLDRQFCFYDIGSNNKKCIKNMFVDNCMMSADFSPDGKYIVMGSQSGKVYIYDTRKLDEPLNIFDAHKSPIKHLSFKRRSGNEEKSDVNSSSSIMSINECVKSENELKPEQQQQQQHNESFNLDYLSVGSPLVNERNKNAIDYDSFIAKIGIDRNQMFESVRNDNGDQQPLSPQSPSSQQIAAHTKILQDKLNENNHHQQQQQQQQQLSSTPNMATVVKELITVSPVASSSTSKSKICCKCEEVVKINDALIRNIVRDELKSVVDDLKSEIKYKFLDLKDEIRNLHLNQMMVMVKESIKIENSFNNLRKEFINESP